MIKYKNYIYRIHWSSPTGDNVKIEYCIGSTDGPWNIIVLSTDAHNHNPDGFYNWRVDISACENLYVRIWDIETDELVAYMDPVDILETVPNLHIQHYGDSISKLGVYSYIYDYILANYEEYFYDVDVINDQGIVGMWMGWYNNALEKGELFLNLPLPHIVLLNSGMHDRTSFADEFDLKFRSFLTDYRQRNPKAILVWANTTHVSEELEDYQLYNDNIDRHSVEAVSALNDIWIPGRFIIVDQRKCQIDNNIPFIGYVHPHPEYYELYADNWIEGLLQAITLFNGENTMGIPNEAQYYIPLTINHDLIEISGDHFPYQVDLSNLLLNSVFKSFIISSKSIAVYDPTTKTVRPRIVDINLTNNKLFISFDGASDADNDKTFYICVGTLFNQSDNSTVFSLSDYTHYWKINEFENGSTVFDAVGINNGTVVSPAIIGSEGKFGNCIMNVSNTGHMTLGNVISMNSVAKISIELLFKLNDVTIESHILIRYISTSNKFMILFASSQLRFFQSNGGSAYGYFATTGISANEWHHLTVVFNGEGEDNAGRMQIYIDGVLKTLTFSGTIPASTYNLSAAITYIGNTSTSFQFIDELGMTSTALSESFIKTRYNQFFDSATFFTIGDGVSLQINLTVDNSNNPKIENISQYIDNKKKVSFINNDGEQININSIILNSEGFVNFYGKGYLSNQSKRLKLSAGKVHNIGGINTILSDGTDTGKGIHVLI